MHVHSKMAKRKAGSVFTITIKHGENKKQKKHIFHCRHIDNSAKQELDLNLIKKRKRKQDQKIFSITLSSVFYFLLLFSH